MAVQKMDIRDIPAERIPRHIAVIMDGNGRWAKKRGMPRLFGHRAGMESLVRSSRPVWNSVSDI